MHNAWPLPYKGCLCPVGVSVRETPWTETPLWTEGQMQVKTLPCPKLYLRAVNMVQTKAWRALFYRPQRSCGQGNVFTAVCDSVHRGGLQQEKPPLGRETPQQGEPPGRENPPGQGEPPPAGRTLAGRTPRQGEIPPWQGEPPWQGDPPGIRSMSGWYASYWNAFLLLTARESQSVHYQPHAYSVTAHPCWLLSHLLWCGRYAS